MKISEVEKITGLTSKAIRFYEEKGLIFVERKDNFYRDYNDDTVNRLKQIKLLRDVGIGISEISLYLNQVVSLGELLDKRKSELERENIENKENYDHCLKLLHESCKKDPPGSETIVISQNAAVIGVDIGTTTISAVLIDIENNSVLETYTVANDSKLATDPDLSEYDAVWITDKAERIIDFLIKAYPNVKSIGFTGQMHGVVYVDAAGHAVSPLYNWQDGRGNRNISRGRTCCDEIVLRTGYTVFTGYGFSSLYYNKLNDLEPEAARSFCTIMDYIAMHLAGKSTPVMHPSNAASLGLYDIKSRSFDREAMGKLHLENLELPKIAEDGERIGYYKNIPIIVPIGDNQASFYGSVKEEASTALVNFGTGSQISVVVETFENTEENLEVRPYLFGKYLLCGSALCGGKAYSILEKFFSSYAGKITERAGAQYELMNSLALDAYKSKKKTALKVTTSFCGTRSNPNLRGSITEIDETNFTPENLILGVLTGMAEELKSYFDRMKAGHVTQLVASGNAVQKNPVLRMLLEDVFGRYVNLTMEQEEAAIGAALYAGVNTAVISEKQTAEIISYRKGENNGLE